MSELIPMTSSKVWLSKSSIIETWSNSIGDKTEHLIKSTQRKALSTFLAWWHIDQSSVEIRESGLWIKDIWVIRKCVLKTLTESENNLSLAEKARISQQNLQDTMPEYLFMNQWQQKRLVEFLKKIEYVHRWIFLEEIIWLKNDHLYAIGDMNERTFMMPTIKSNYNRISEYYTKFYLITDYLMVT